jgi:hypothetical protein
MLAKDGLLEGGAGSDTATLDFHHLDRRTSVVAQGF